MNAFFRLQVYCELVTYLKVVGVDTGPEHSELRYNLGSWQKKTNKSIQNIDRNDRCILQEFRFRSV